MSTVDPLAVYYVQAIAKEGATREWVTHAETRSYDLALAMTECIGEGFDNHPGHAADTRVLWSGHPGVPEDDLIQALGQAAEAIKGFNAEDIAYRDALEACARKRLGT